MHVRSCACHNMETSTGSNRRNKPLELGEIALYEPADLRSLWGSTNAEGCATSARGEAGCCQRSCLAEACNTGSAHSTEFVQLPHRKPVSTWMH